MSVGRLLLLATSLVLLVGCATSTDPVEVMSDAAAVTGNQRHACGLSLDGTVRCWGANLYGQLGNGSTDDVEAASTAVIGVRGATSVSAGHDFSCAVIQDGSVRCWGFNLAGQLGDGTVLNIAMESRRVVGLDGATAVAAGGNHACAVVDGGAVRCWGGNEFGQLGDGTTEDHLRPEPVPGLRGVTALSAGNGFTCALVEDGSVRCWGVNGLGQLGDGGEEDRAEPGRVRGLTDVATIASGLVGSCVTLTDGGVQCWGGVDLEVGRGGSGALHRPGDATGIRDVTRVAVGERQSCAADAGGQLFCWDNVTGADTSGDPQPRPEGAPTDPVSIAIWGDRVCLVAQDAALTCDRIA